MPNCVVNLTSGILVPKSEGCTLHGPQMGVTFNAICSLCISTYPFEVNKREPLCTFICIFLLPLLPWQPVSGSHWPTASDLIFPNRVVQRAGNALFFFVAPSYIRKVSYFL